eukprot:scaffold97375_cov70-Phaeocystis_antarctica.AAC.4
MLRSKPSAVAARCSAAVSACHALSLPRTAGATGATGAGGAAGVDGLCGVLVGRVTAGGYTGFSAGVDGAAGVPRLIELIPCPRSVTASGTCAAATSAASPDPDPSSSSSSSASHSAPV